jgi:hypothetical protein
MGNPALAMLAMKMGPDVIGGVTSSVQARKASNTLKEKEELMKKIMDTRQDIPNPMDNYQDLSGMITNPYANLSVATKAAEMQAEEADISLANTLDTMRATGAGAGGATALAQAAAKSKEGVAASIETQEASNARLKAQGEQAANQAMMQEKQRMQTTADASQKWMFGQTEAREDEQIQFAEKQADRAWSEKWQYKNQARGYWDSAGDTLSSSGISTYGQAMGVDPSIVGQFIGG